MENQGKSVYEKGRKDKTKIKAVEENWKSVEMERVAERKVATGQGRWLGTNVGTSISPSYVLLSALAPPGLVRITILYIIQFMELRQGLRGHFR